MYYELKDKVGSPLEDMFLKDCISVGLVVEPQVRIGRYRTDFFIRNKNLIIEVDGKYHESEEQQLKDTERDNFFMWERWFRIIRIKGTAAYKYGDEIASDIKVFIESDEFKNNRIGIWTYEKDDDGFCRYSYGI